MATTQVNSLAQQAQELRERIHDADRAYYVYNDPVMTDGQYDALMQKLRKIEQEAPNTVTPDSPTQRVPGDNVAGFETQPHRSPMLSIDNAFDDEAIGKWIKSWADGCEMTVPEVLALVMIEPKIDGAAVNLIYEDGKLVAALTRGDGQNGDNILVNVMTIREIPVKLDPLPDRAYGAIEVRGEIFIAKEAFARFQDQSHAAGKRLAANARNLAAGTMRLHEPKEVKRRNLSFLGHGYVLGQNRQDRQDRVSDGVETFRAAGVPWVGNYARKGMTEVAQLFEHLKMLRTDVAPNLPMEIDGWVLKLDSARLRALLGEGSKYPRWAVACKLETYTANTELLAVTLQVGRLGTVTPVAKLAPVVLDGSTVEAASLHNMDQIKRLDLHIGDIVEVQKAGKIIPQVVRVVKRTATRGKIATPEKCPVCATTLKRGTNSDDSQSVAIYCPNTGCNARLAASILHFASRDVMDIDGLGEELVEELITAKLVTKLPDLYYLHKRADAVQKHTRLAKRGSEKLFKAIEASRAQPYWRVIRGLGIPLIGETYAKRLAKMIDTPVDLLQLSAAALAKQLPSAAVDAIRDYAQVAENCSLVKELVVGFEVGQPEVAAVAASTKLAGKTLVVTGTLQRGTRDEIHRLIESHGGTIGSSVSKKTSILVCGEDAGSKLDKAHKLNVPVLTEAEFFAHLES